MLRVLDEKDDLSIQVYLQREGYLVVSFPLPSGLLISHWFCRSLYDGRSVGHPARCMRHGRPSPNLGLIHGQTLPVANHLESLVA